MFFFECASVFFIFGKKGFPRSQWIKKSVPVPESLPLTISWSGVAATSSWPTRTSMYWNLWVAWPPAAAWRTTPDTGETTPRSTWSHWRGVAADSKWAPPGSPSRTLPAGAAAELELVADHPLLAEASVMEIGAA